MPAFKPVVEISREARSHARVLPVETRQSYPVPGHGPKKNLRIAFFYCTQNVVPFQGALVLPPSHRAYLDAATGTFEELKAVSPMDFGRNDDPATFLGVAKPSDGVTSEDFPALEERFYHLYDLVLPVFAGGRTKVAPAALKEVAEFRSLFGRLSEIPLRPYYASEGKEFFAWLAQVSP
jgi:hypothetical protein